MNVLILTPDAVGSTLLQRVLTIYMQFHQFDKPVINLHELTNGLIKYHNDKFNQDVLGKPEVPAWGYHQSLEEIVGLLSSADHYKTARLAQYHIKNRQDRLQDQLSFYQYLNDNFFIISCRRHNVFEHALSWAINKVTKKLNVYSADEKISSFYHLYRDQLTIEPDVLIHSLNSYKNYIQWCEDHFFVGSYFYYDQHLHDIEKYVLDLPVFAGQAQKISWKDQYNISFNDWNKCRYLSSDVGTIAMDHQTEFKKLSQTAVDVNTPGSMITVSKNVSLALPHAHTKFIGEHSENYSLANRSISRMVNDRTMVSPPPIKKQTLNEKKFLVKNFEQCLDTYNNWIAKNPKIGNQIDMSVVNCALDFELTYWDPNAGQGHDPTVALLK